MPRFVPRLGAGESLTGLTPAFACVTSRPAAPKIQQPLALRIKVEKVEHLPAFRWFERAFAADELVVRHAAVGEDYRSPRLDPSSRAARKTWSEHYRVKQIAFKSHVARHGAVVERARQGRDEVEVTGGSAFQKATPRNFDDHVNFRRLRDFLAGMTST
jgi:hypothetical protein